MSIKGPELPDTPPLVTVGVPVRNGGATLRRALQSVVGQTYRNLDIVVSDNCSTDSTAAISAEFAARDSRVRYVRHAEPLTALENFRFLVEQCSSEYFMWAAHDDFRTANYVEVLVDRLEMSAEAVLSYTDTVLFSREDEDLGSITPIGSELTWGNSFTSRINKVLSNKCSVMYGMFRTRYLREYSWIHADLGPDVALLLHMRSRGEFVYAPGAMFYEWIVPGGVLPAAERARNEALRPIRRFRFVRLAWACTTALAQAERLEGRSARRAAGFVASYVPLRESATRLWIYEHLPESGRRVWHRYFRPEYAKGGARTAQDSVRS